MKTLGIAALAVGLLGLVSGARAEEKDLSGTWKWTVERGGQKRDVLLKLKKEGDKYSGTITAGKDMNVKVDDLAVKDGTISFNVTRKFKDMEFTSKYSGKVEGNKIKGMIVRKSADKEDKMDWEATKATD